MIIVGFPGIGKTYLRNNNHLNNINFLDENDYRELLIENSKKYSPHTKIYEIIVDISIKLSRENKVILMSPSFLEFFIEKDVNLTLVYPDINLKEQYLKRYRDRGDDQEFIEKMNREWDEEINKLHSYRDKYKSYVLRNDVYLSSAINSILS